VEPIRHQELAADISDRQKRDWDHRPRLRGLPL